MKDVKAHKRYEGQRGEDAYFEEVWELFDLLDPELMTDEEQIAVFVLLRYLKCCHENNFDVPRPPLSSVKPSKILGTGGGTKTSTVYQAGGLVGDPIAKSTPTETTKVGLTAPNGSVGSAALNERAREVVDIATDCSESERDNWPTAKRIVHVLRASGEKMGVKDIYDALIADGWKTVSSNPIVMIQTYMSQLIKDGTVDTDIGGLYMVREHKEGA